MDGISTAADFKRRAAEHRAREAKPLKLPSGLTVLAFQPSPEWWVRELGRLPQSMAARVVGITANGNGDTMTSETLVEFARWTARLLDTVVVEPKIKLNPGADDLDPAAIDDDDLAYLIRFAGGEVAADGSDLDSFSRRRRATDGADPRGRPLVDATERTS